MIKVLSGNLAAVRAVLKIRKYLLIFLALTVVIAGAFITIQLIAIPGNDLKFQLSIYRPRDYMILGALALFTSLNFTLQAHITARRKQALNTAMGGLVGGTSGVFASIVGTAACSSCLAGVFGALGLGSGAVFFVLERQTYFFVGALLLVTTSLYFTLRRLQKHCAC